MANSEESPPQQARVEVQVVTENLETPQLDDRSYRVIRLPNQLEALLVHDPTTDKAAAAVDVNVGSHSDEDDMPGMAHAVEHLLFMGTKKFPVENAYHQYMSNHSGLTNAFTATTSTNYHFEVSAKPSNDEEPSATNPSPLLGALDRFAQFFIEPLFLENTLDRELRAVDSENKKNLQSDNWRLHQLKKTISNPKHPNHHFSTGNLETLKTIPEAKGINVRDKFIEFYEKHYSANRMKLCVLGREPLDVLQAWVTEYFSPIKNKDLPRNRWEDEVPYTKDHLGVQIFAKPVMDTRELTLSFPFMEQENLYETQPGGYISHLIGHEGPGSIMSYVKSKGWANGLGAGPSTICPGSPDQFEIGITLTKEGLKNYKEIVKAVFEYIALLRETEPQQWIFDEQKGMADVNFRFMEKSRAYRFASSVSQRMQKPIPREHLVSGYSKLRRFDPKLIKEALGWLRPDNFFLVVTSRNPPVTLDNKEKWYGTEYTIQPIPEALMKEVQTAAASTPENRKAKLHLPHKNQFIPTKLDVERKEVKEPAIAPRIIRNDPTVRTWYKKDDTFWVPKASIMVSCRTPITSLASMRAAGRLFTDLIKDALEEYSYDAELAGVEYTVICEERGMYVEVSGYNDKLSVLLEQVLVTMRDLDIRDDRFAIIKERTIRSYRNWELSAPWTQIGGYMSWLTTDHYNTILDIAEELPAVTADAVRSFKRDFLAQMHMEVLVHGNFYKEDALKLTDMIERTIKPRPLPPSQWRSPRGLVFSPGSNYVWKKTLKDPANVNHSIHYMLYTGAKIDRPQRARTALLDQIMHEPCFDQLRTKEQLGYIVYCGSWSNVTTFGVYFIIQSEKTAPYLETRIEKFLEDMGKRLEDMSDGEFEKNKRSLIERTLEKAKSLEGESNRHWQSIESEYYMFNNRQLIVDNLKPLTKTDMVEFFNHYIKPSSPSRAKVAAYLEAQAKSDVTTKQITDLIKALDLDESTAAQTATDLQSRLSAAGHDEEKEVEGLVDYLNGLGVPEARIKTASDVWRKLHSEHGPGNGVVKDAEPPSSNGTTPTPIKNVRDFKALHATSRAPYPEKDLAEYFDLDPKLEHQPEDLVLPSTEDIDPSFSFTEQADIPDLDTPTYVRHGDSLPPSGVPPRLQTQCSSVADSPSVASSPCASADLSVDFDRGADFLDPAPSLRPTDWTLPGSQSTSLHSTVHRALMGAAADLPQRSSSPLKRPASSMEPETDNMNAKEDVAMNVDNDSATRAVNQEPVQKETGNDEAMDATPLSPKEPTTEPNGLPLRNDIPPLDQQIKTIETLVKAFAETPIQDGDQAYLVSRQWLQRAQAFGLDSKHVSKEVPEGTLGPVDNSDIIQAIFTDSNGVECVKLKPGLGTESFELFPKDAWDLLLSWYGLVPGQAPVIRFAHNTAPDAVSEPVIQFEFHPPVFTIHRLWSATSPIPIEQEIKLKKPGPPIVVQSTSFSYHKFLKQVKSLAGVATDRKVRVWRVLQTIPATEATAPEPSEPSGMMKTPPDSPIQGTSVPNGLPVVPGAWPEMLVDVVTFLQLEKDVQRALVEAEDTTTNANYNGKKSLSLIGLNVDQTLVLDEEIERNMYISTFINRNLNDKNPATRNSSTALVQARANTSGRSSPALSAPLTRGRAQQKPGRTNGCVGLQNLGNTCYMNSALQCLRAVEELTKYFLTKEAQKEINADNPLSHNGDVAVAYGRLLDEIYRDPTPNSIAPRQFKSVIGRYAPTFSGYGQQDSQEFLGWLLDGLQEDLNRILKKPYIEKPDSTDEMINNPAAIREMALKVWDITKKRDDSVIADLFTGLYKSTLVCPECNKISITFDPFNNLTLPLPMANSWSRTVKFYPLNEPPVQIVVDIDKNSSFKTMKQFISQRVGVPVDRLMASEEYSGKFFKHYDDLSTVSEEITSNDIATVHELEAPPSNLELTKQAKKPKYKSLLSDNDEDDMMEDPMAQSMVVPVLHIGIHGKNKGKNNKGGSLPPHFIILTPDEACSEDIIRRKVLEKVATFTTHPGLATVEEADAGDNIDPEMVNMASDVDSRDSNITAKSVEGEEDIVDVTMADAGEAPKPAVAGAAEQSPQLLKVFKHQRPKWMNPKEFLDPEFQNLFELSFFTEGGANSIPTGWSSVNDGNAHARLSTRQPKPIVSDVEMQSPGAWPNSDESGSEEVNEATRMADESSEDDSDFPHVKNLQPRSIGPVNQVSTRGGKKKVKPRQQTYSKKGKKRFEKQQKARVRKQQASTPDFGPVEGPLVRLGEGIIVEWNENAWEVLFEGTPGEPMRGCKTYENLDTLVDPALEVKKKQRLLRKKHGIALDDCLDEFEKEEILSEQDTWYCPRCKEHRRASKKFDLWKTPDILVVHLKRFSSSGFRREKLDTLVDFPVEGLDLTSRVIDKEDGKQEIYDLIAVDDHWGGLGGGHYTAFAKNFNDGLWYEYNDTSVSKCSDPQKVVTPAAYLLFYRRRSDEPLGGLRFHEILDKYDNQVAAADQDMSDSGEGQRLGQGSSLRGSPSASTGAGLTLPQGKRGLVSDDSDRTGRALVLADAEPPSYQASITNVDEDTEMGAVLWDQTTLHNSIEGDEDEGIGLPDYDNGGMAGMTSVISPSWNFSNIKAGSAASDGDIASDIAQNDNSSLDDAFAAGDDMDEVFMGAPTIGFVEPEPTFPDEDIPAPPAEAQNFLDQIAEDKWAQQQIHTVPVNIDDDQASDKVAEIRVGDNGDNGDNGDTGGTGEAHVQKPSV
ncbi:UCH-domain-containing protein [Triangularia verruculosa]|uniref:UCH-domain-containing protein n=1 Tax=Triangularia verruculosa TaxID=2587418 RepID=A0AAN6XQ67_9PEZI|nr:UCH-domain-containing protein [Triangularia verruculosa]